MWHQRRGSERQCGSKSKKTRINCKNNKINKTKPYLHPDLNGAIFQNPSNIFINTHRIHLNGLFFPIVCHASLYRRLGFHLCVSHSLRFPFSPPWDSVLLVVLTHFPLTLSLSAYLRRKHGIHGHTPIDIHNKWNNIKFGHKLLSSFDTLNTVASTNTCDNVTHLILIWKIFTCRTRRHQQNE